MSEAASAQPDTAGTAQGDKTTDKSNPNPQCQSDSSMHEIETKTSWEVQKSLLWQALPVILLLLTSVLVQNILSILALVALIVAFDTVNDVIIRQSEDSRQVRFIKTIFLMLYMLGCICLAYPVVSDHWLFKIHDFKDWWTSDDVTFWSTVLLVTTIDFLCKYATMSLKCVMLLLSGRVIHTRNRGRMFMACEGLSQIFRCLLPIPEWSRYIITCDMCFSAVLCWLFLVLYIFLKFKAAKKKLMILVSAWKYGTVTGAKLQTAESQDISALQDVKLCPICHDNFLEPVRLPCGHIFCTSCISVWFDREKHCPKCSSDGINSLILGFQAALPPLVQYTSSNNKWKTGATDYVIQFF